MRTTGTLLALLGLAATAAADTFTDNFFTPLSDSQITPGDTWLVTGLNTRDDLILTGDTYVADITFTNNELLRVEGLNTVLFQVHAVSSAIYTVDFDYLGKFFPSGSGSLATGSATSDLSGIAGDQVAASGPMDPLLLSGVRLELDMAAGNTSFATLDIGLTAQNITIVPEPASLGLLALASLALMRRRL
jgi:hypothetical protein